MLEAIFLFITLLTLSLFYIGTGKDLRLVLIFIVWQLLIGLLSYFEVFKEKPQLFPLAIVATILFSVLCLRMITVSKLKRIFLIGIHIVRIPVELCLYALYIESQVPEIMTFSGWNFDVLIGISAGTIFIYELVKNNTVARKSFIVWNYIGLLFLSFIVIIAILSSPLPIQQFAFEQPNLALFQFPYCFLPTCIVPLVYLSHILLIKDTINYNSQK